MENQSLTTPLSRPSILDFKDYREFLKEAGLPKSPYNQKNTLMKWAKRLGYRSPSSLTMVLRGQRLPSQEMLDAFEKDFQLSSLEREYFELLIKIEKAEKKNQDPLPLLQKLEKLSLKNRWAALGLKEFSSISEWYFLAIKQLTSLSDFEENNEWIRKKLRKKVTPSQIQYALETMLELGILKRNTDGQIIHGDHPRTTSNDIPSSAIKKHHAGMIHQSLNALEEQPVEERQFSSLTLKFDKKKVSEAKSVLLKFLQDFNNRFYAENGDSVYQVNLQLFDLTTKKVSSQETTRGLRQ